MLSLSGDGLAMYTIQALWTMAREKLNVTSINKAYAILNVELQRVGAKGYGDKARSQLDLSNPGLDFVLMGNGMGVHSVRATTTEELVVALEYALRTPGPHLIVAMVPNAFSGLRLRLLRRVLDSLRSLPQPMAQAIKREVAP